MANEKRSTGWHGPLDRFTPGKSLKPMPGGLLDVVTDPAGPIYDSGNGLTARLDTALLALTTGSPVKIGLSEQAKAMLESVPTVQATQTAQAKTIASHTSALAALSPLPAPGAAVPALALGAPIDLITALAAIVELQTTVATLRLRLQTFGVISP